jgi:hypothetical protein
VTVLIVAACMVALTVALLAEEVSWQRRQRRLAARRVPSMRCHCCPGAPVVDDFRTHSRLAHGYRAPAPEDSEEWA